MKPINEITKEELLAESLLIEVFEIENELDRERVLCELSDRAGDFHIKTKFNDLVNAYKKEFKQYQKEQAKLEQKDYGNVTQFGVEKYNGFITGEWIANESGIRRYLQSGREILACYHPILPVKLLINVQTGTFKVKLAYRKRNQWKEIIVPKGQVASSRKIVNLANNGISVTSESAKNLVEYLSYVENKNADRIEVQKSTSKLGWIKGEFMPYGHSIIVDSDQQFKDAYESVHEEGDRDTWYHLVKKIRKSSRLEPKIYLAASLASVLVEPLNALPFIINLWGDTGKGKTVALMLAASVWANPENGKYITDPKSTITALELRMDFLNDLPVLIDDLAQVKQKYNGDFSELIYFLCSGKGKERSNENLGLNRPTSWKNVILTNAEWSIIDETTQGGAINRVIDVEMAHGYVFKNGNQIAEVLRKNYGFCGRDFIDLINRNGIDRIKEIQQEFYRIIIETARGKGVEKEEKQILPMSIILTADKLATEYLFEDDIYLDIDTCVDLLKNKSEVSENKRAYDFIMSEIAVHMNNFKPNQATGEYRGEVWGCIDDIRGEQYAIIQNNIFNDFCKRGKFSKKSFLSWAEKKRMLETGNDNLKTKVKKVNGNNARCVFLKMKNEEPKMKYSQETLHFVTNQK